MAGGYRFVPVTRADLPLLERWLSGAHMSPWWGDPAEEIALIEEEIGIGPTDMRIVHHGETPFAFVQDWDATTGPQFGSVPPGSRAVDTFLGEPSWLGKGHAPRYLRARALELLVAGAPEVVIDPDPENARAISAYRRAGFHGEAIRTDGEGYDVLVMTFSP
ncbi:GNAT family N-acetyltransferase [Pseudoroseicyclus sp. CXY001]|uniref:GNAT family N-acetyltransferase n=1 Tax=Pseudoroseicyclus sp. CXY001 TaxID=3242492 RepID=UPI00357179A7